MGPVPGGSTSLRARSPHGAAVLMGATSLGARPPCALAVLTALQSSWGFSLLFLFSPSLPLPAPGRRNRPSAAALGLVRIRHP
jgi:hypothetical protein